MEVKEVNENGSFTGIASVHDVEDLGGDVIEKGAFRKTLAENPEVLVLWHHNPNEIIGKGHVREQGNSIILDAQLDMDDPTAQKVYSKLKKKLLKGLSIGFQAVKSKWEQIEEEQKSRMVRRISELKLFEVSVVAFPMLPAAQVMRVKSDSRIEALEKQVQALLAAQVATSERKSEAGAGEGAAASSTEPVGNHSGLIPVAERLRALVPR